MSAQPDYTYMTPDEYLAFEAESEIKHEYIDGEIYAMSGASRNHIVIAGNIYTAFRLHSRQRGCMTYQADMNVLARARHYYPDVVVTCHDEVFVEDAPIAVLRNPLVIVEVLSPSTAGKDRTQKLDDYLAIPSLKNVLFVWQDTPRVDVIARASGAEWLTRRTDGLDASVTVPALEMSLPLRDVYMDVTWPDDTE